MCCSTLKIGKILFILGIYLLQLGKKTYFLALGTIPVTGVGFIARKITETFSNLNISATSGPIITKFYLNHHWGGGKAALGYGPDRIGTLVSMATDSSHRVIMGKML